MMMGGFIAGISGLLGVVVETSRADLAGSVWTWPILFLLLNIGYTGVRVGRKTFVVDICGGEKRTDYVSAGNTVVAIMILVLGGIASVLHTISSIANLCFFSVLCLLGAVFVLKLPGVHAPD